MGNSNQIPVGTEGGGGVLGISNQIPVGTEGGYWGSQIRSQWVLRGGGTGDLKSDPSGY